ncbi:MAG: hypothetical protein LBS32_04340 [Clostridiales Family XIII bacterium]|jgi:hypothetical protein|nr:hypothetical protein [Clostridiales Family XIII bacterium]
MRPKLYKHLFKEQIWRRDPHGVFGHEVFWMEGSKDMEGFGGSYAFSYVTKEGPLLPQAGAMLVHPYDTVLAFVATDYRDILELGAEVSLEIGEERETYTFALSQLVNIPRGVPYGNVRVADKTRDFGLLCVYLAPEYRAKTIPAGDIKAPVPGRKYAKNVRVFAWGVDEKGKALHSGGAITEKKDGSGMGYSRVADERGVMHPLTNAGPGGMGPGNADSLVWAFGDEMLGFELNMLWGHYTQCGKWHRGGEQHVHPAEEILLIFGLDPNDPLHVGAEVEESMGPEDERYHSSVPCVWICPKDFEHLPQITRWVDRPYAFSAISLDRNHLSPWIDEHGNRIEHS